MSAADGVHCVRCHRNRLVVNDGHMVGGGGIIGCMAGTSEIYSEGHVTASACQRRSMLRYCPPYLIIQLLRFTAHCKLTTPVAVSRRLLLGDHVAMGDDAEYVLRALCCHVDSASVNDGHYVTYATSDDVTWHRFDDDTVTGVNMDQELMSESVLQNVYLLFYRRITSP